jgi:Fe-S cluster biogenesis protein NfuA
MTFREQVEEVLEQVRPQLQAHRGDVELVDVVEDEGLVQVRLQGACQGCPMAQMTMTMGIEYTLKEQIPEVQKVEAVD